MTPKPYPTASVLVLAAAVLLGGAPLRAASPVRYGEAVEHSARRTLQLTGSVESLKSAVAAAEVAGLVVALQVLPGDAVQKGEPLARLRTVTYEIGLRAAESALREARSRLDLAATKLGRAEKLFADEVISQDQLDDAVSESTAWQARVDQSLADIDGYQVALNRCVVRAPFTGVIVEKLTEVGEWMPEGGAVVDMVSLDRLEVRVEVPEQWYDSLRRGLESRVTFDAIPGLEVSGSIREIVPRADPVSRSFPVKIAIPNPERRIGVGLLARVELPIGEPRPAVIVPKDAVVRQGGEEFVYRIGSDDTVERIPVRSVQGVGDWMAIDGPIVPGDRLVTRGNERLRPGQAVSGERDEHTLP